MPRLSLSPLPARRRMLFAALVGGVALAGGVALGGCAKQGQQVASSTPAGKRGPACETASGQATSFGRSTALLYAGTAMKAQTAEIRGELLQSGWRHIRVGPATATCEPLPGAFRGIGLASCRSYAQVCGR
jgi:hypothetical protein